MLTLEIITPDDKVLNTNAEQVVLPTESGEAGILSDHMPMVTKIVAGELKLINKGQTEAIAVDHGFAKILGNTISVLTEAAIDVKEIDLSELEAAQARAEEALKVAKIEDCEEEEILSLESKIRYLIAQKLAKGRRQS